MPFDRPLIRPQVIVKNAERPIVYPLARPLARQNLYQDDFYITSPDATNFNEYFGEYIGGVPYTITAFDPLGDQLLYSNTPAEWTHNNPSGTSQGAYLGTKTYVFGAHAGDLVRSPVTTQNVDPLTYTASARLSGSGDVQFRLISSQQVRASLDISLTANPTDYVISGDFRLWPEALGDETYLDVVNDSAATPATVTIENFIIYRPMVFGLLDDPIDSPDYNLFDVDADTGEVTFKNPPDYDAPLDADQDNVYVITVTANNTLERVSKKVRITVDEVIIPANAIQQRDGRYLLTRSAEFIETR